MNTPASTNTQSGAAMLGIVLVIVVILLALVGALAIGPQLQNITTERQTVKRANVIVDAVRQYYLARGELPEPSSVPVDDLNLEQKNKFDAWGQEWCYYRATIQDPDSTEPDDRITDITGLEVDTGSGNALQVAGVLISSGPDQEFDSIRECPAPNNYDIESITKDGDDIVIPLNVQGEAVQIAKDELEVLAGRGCPAWDVGEDELEWDGSEERYQYLIDFGLSDSYGRDPWWTGGDDEKDKFNYEWEWHAPGDSGWWISSGPDNNEIRSRFVDGCSAPEGALVALDTSFIKDTDSLDDHPHVIEAGSTPEIKSESVGNVLDFDYSGGVNNFIEMVDVANPEDICEYTIMGWFRAGEMDTSRQTIANRRPAGGGHFQTWLFGLNADDNSTGDHSSITPLSETYLTASRGGDSAWPYLRMYTSQGIEGRNAPTLRTPWRGMGFYPNRDSADHYGEDFPNRSWHFFAINVKTDEDTEVDGLSGLNDNSQYCDVSHADDEGRYRASMYMSDMSDQNSPDKLHVVELTPKGESASEVNTILHRGPDVGPDGNDGTERWRNFLGRLATSGSHTPFDGQIARYYIYDRNNLLNHSQIVQYFENTCDIFTTNCQKNPVYNFSAMTSDEIEDFINDPRIRSSNKDHWGVCDPDHGDANYHCDEDEPSVRILKNIDFDDDTNTDGDIFIPIPNDYDEYTIRAVARLEDTSGEYGIFYDTTLKPDNTIDDEFLWEYSTNTDLHLIELEVRDDDSEGSEGREVTINVYDLVASGDGAGEIWDTSPTPVIETSSSIPSDQKYTGFRTSDVRSNFLYLEIEEYE